MFSAAADAMLVAPTTVLIRWLFDESLLELESAVCRFRFRTVLLLLLSVLLTLWLAASLRAEFVLFALALFEEEAFCAALFVDAEYAACCAAVVPFVVLELFELALVEDELKFELAVFAALAFCAWFEALELLLASPLLELVA